MKSGIKTGKDFPCDELLYYRNNINTGLNIR